MLPLKTLTLLRTVQVGAHAKSVEVLLLLLGKAGGSGCRVRRQCAALCILVRMGPAAGGIPVWALQAEVQLGLKQCVC